MQIRYILFSFRINLSISYYKINCKTCYIFLDTYEKAQEKLELALQISHVDNSDGDRVLTTDKSNFRKRTAPEDDSSEDDFPPPKINLLPLPKPFKRPLRNPQDSNAQVRKCYL